MEQPHVQAQYIDVDALRNSPYAKVMYHTNHQYLRAQFKPILEKRGQLAQNANVHDLDVFYTANVGNLINIAKAVFLANGNLSLEQVKTNLKTFIKEHPQILAEYRYEGKAFEEKKMINYIDQAYHTDMPVELCSHVYNLSIQIFNARQIHPEYQYEYGVHSLFDAIVENYETGGGCLQGRRNRQFGALALMLHHCGLRP